MTKETFRYIWEQGIKKAVEGLMDEIHQDIFNSTDYGISCDVSDDMFEKVYTKYENYRIQVREKYFDVGKNDENKMDGHKICACITGAMLNFRLISYDLTVPDIPAKIAYANYAVAFLSGIYVMYLFLLSDFEKNGETECYEELEKEATFEFPETNPGHDSYIQGRIKTLAMNDLYGNEFDVLNHADMLFWIEKYNKDLIYKKIKTRTY